MTLEIFGYHGTAEPIARKILETRTFKPSTNRYDWLGRGIYFFQDGPQHAFAIATTRAQQYSAANPHESCGPAIIRARISLRSCIDLLDSKHWAAIKFVHDDLEKRDPKTLQKLRNSQRSLATCLSDPSGRGNGQNNLDCVVMNTYILRLQAALGASQPKSVRAAFCFRDRIYENSFFGYEDHVQISVFEQTQHDVIVELESHRV